MLGDYRIPKDVSINCHDLALVNKPDRHVFVIQTLNEWFLRNRHSLNAPTADLIETQDFRLLLIYNGSSEEACITCSCGIRVQLTRLRENFSLSNYYKHLKSKTCAMMKRKKEVVNSIVNDEHDAMDDEETVDNVDTATVSSAATVRSSASTIVLATSTNAQSSIKRSRTVESKSLSKRTRVQ